MDAFSAIHRGVALLLLDLMSKSAPPPKPGPRTSKKPSARTEPGGKVVFRPGQSTRMHPITMLLRQETPAGEKAALKRIRAALVKTHGSKLHAADLLETTWWTLSRWMKDLDLDDYAAELRARARKKPAR